MDLLDKCIAMGVSGRRWPEVVVEAWTWRQEATLGSASALATSVINLRVSQPQSLSHPSPVLWL